MKKIVKFINELLFSTNNTPKALGVLYFCSFIAPIILAESPVKFKLLVYIMIYIMLHISLYILNKKMINAQNEADIRKWGRILVAINSLRIISYIVVCFTLLDLEKTNYMFVIWGFHVDYQIIKELLKIPPPLAEECFVVFLKQLLWNERTKLERLGILLGGVIIIGFICYNIYYNIYYNIDTNLYYFFY